MGLVYRSTPLNVTFVSKLTDSHIPYGIHLTQWSYSNTVQKLGDPKEVLSNEKNFISKSSQNTVEDEKGLLCSH